MKYFGEETYNKVATIITDNWAEKESVQLDMIVNQLNMQLEDAKAVYEVVMDHLISNVKIN